MVLNFKICIKDSKIVSGKGVYTEEFIPKGAVFWELDDTCAVIFQNGDQFNEYIKNKTKEEIDDILVHIYGEHGKGVLLLDGTQYMNHSFEPNLLTPKFETKSYALRDIQAGEELFENYQFYHTLDYADKLSREHGVVTCSEFAVHLKNEKII